MTITLNPDEIYTIKLTSGEELVAKVLKVQDQWITVSNPLSVAPGPQGMALMPAMFTQDPRSEPQINTATITVWAPTDSTVRSKYLEATTGLRVPDKKLVLG